MTPIKIESIEPGMVLAEDVLGSNGQILLRAGTEVAESHLRILGSRGIQEVTIRDIPAMPETREPLAPDEMDTIIRDRFSKVDTGNPLIAELLGICRERLS